VGSVVSSRTDTEPEHACDAHTASRWDPEDTVAWEAGGKYVARRNQIWSVGTGSLHPTAAKKRAAAVAAG
jgi:hypothetical protein